jgi:hypothetical protein
MPTPVQGELIRHHNKPFYAQQSSPRYFWTGCLGPLAVLLFIGFFIIQGATTAAGIGVIRNVALFAIIFLVVQLIFGGGLFVKNKSSLGRGLLAGAGVVLLLLILGMIGLVSTLGSFLQ